MGPVGEQKTKPTQHTVKELMGLGITPDVLVCRSSKPLNEETREKLAAFCHVHPNAVFSTHDVPNVYHVPLMLEKQGFCKILDIDCTKTGILEDWKKMAYRLDELTEDVHIAMVGKYTGLSDAYLSVIKSLQHAALAVGRRLTIDWIEASDLLDSNNSDAWNVLRKANGVLVPGGFGIRGIEGKYSQRNTLAKTTFPISGFVLVCRLLPLNSVVTFSASKMQHPPNSMRTQPTLQSSSCQKSQRHTLVEQCVLVPDQRSSKSTIVSLSACTVDSNQSMNVIDIATKSIRISLNRLRRQGSNLLEKMKADNDVRFSNLKDIPTTSEFNTILSSSHVQDVPVLRSLACCSPQAVKRYLKHPTRMTRVVR